MKSNNQHPFKKILVALDISDQTELVIQTAAYLINALNASAEVVTVVNVPTHSPGNEMDGTPANKDENQLREDLISRLHPYFTDEEIRKLEMKVLHGDPSERITEYADHSQCDLIVLGSRSQGALKKAILGSVSGSVVAKSKKSVLIVK